MCNVVTMIDFSRNHFELLGLPVRYRVDGVALDRAYRDLQSSVHPDRYASSGDAEKRQAMQASARVNEAYGVLRDPVARAEYLLSLQGIDAAAENDNRLPVEFLTRELARREQAEEASDRRDIEALARLADDVRAEARARAADVERVLDENDLDAARSLVRELRFLAKVGDDFDALHAAEIDR